MEFDIPLDVDLELQVDFNTSRPLAQAQSNGDKVCVISVDVWSSAKGVPRIFSSTGGRRQDCFGIDQRLHGAETPNALAQIVKLYMPTFDVGNFVVAVSQAAKISEDGNQASWKAYPILESLLIGLLADIEKLEPRGLSMLAYSLAKLSYGEISTWASLAQASVQRASDFGAMDIAKLCWALAKLGASDGASVSSDPNFQACWEAMAKEVGGKITSGRPTDISMIAWSFASAEIGEPAMYRRIAEASLTMLDDLSPQCLSNVVWACAMMSYKDDQVADIICQRAREVVAEFAEYDVANLVWALAEMDVVDYELFDILADHLIKSGLWKRLPALMASQIAWAFASARLHHAGLFDALSEYMSRHVNVFEAQHVATAAWAFAVLAVEAPPLFKTISNYARGGRLWNLNSEELCALLWALVRRRWEDDQALGDLVHVASLRANELGSESLANLLWSLATLRSQGKVFASDLEMAIEQLLDYIVEALSSRSIVLADANADAMAVWCLLQLGREQDAWAMCSQPEGQAYPVVLRSHGVLLADAGRRRDAAGAARAWSQLAAIESRAALRAAFLACAALDLAVGGWAFEAHGVLQGMRDMGLYPALSSKIAARLSTPDGPTALTSGFSISSLSWSKLENEDFNDEQPYHQDVSVLKAALASWSTTADFQQLPKAIPEIMACIAAPEDSGQTPCDQVFALNEARRSVFDELVSRHRPRVILELRSGLGAVSVLMAARMRSLGIDGLVVAIEEDPVRCAIARLLSELAGLDGFVAHVVGSDCSALEPVLADLGVRQLDMVVLRGCAGGQADLGALESLGVLRSGSIVCVDRPICPGAPTILARLHADQRFEAISGAFGCPPAPGGGGVDGALDLWTYVCRVAQDVTPLASQTSAENFYETFAGLASLAAESDRLWGRLVDPSQTQEARRAAHLSATRLRRRSVAALKRWGVLT